MPSRTRDTRWHWFPVYLHAPFIRPRICDSGPCFYRFSPAFIFRTLWRPKRGAPPATRTPDSDFVSTSQEHFRSPRVTQPRLLLVDDEEIFVRGLSRELSKLGWQVQIAGNAESALRALRQSEFDAVVLDQELPGTRGVEILTELARVLARPVAVLLSGQLSVATTVHAIQAGASDVLEKPISAGDLDARLGRLLETRDRSASVNVASGNGELRKVLGETAGMRAAREQMQTAARYPELCLTIVGESGTGKEQVAEAIHAPLAGGVETSGQILAQSCAISASPPSPPMGSVAPPAAQSGPTAMPDSRRRARELEPLSADRFGVHFTADAELRDLIERARALASHRLPNGDLASLMKLMRQVSCVRKRSGASASERDAEATRRERSSNRRTKPCPAPRRMRRPPIRRWPIPW